MSDIDIQFPWWIGAIFVLLYAFWPLTALAAGAGIWAYVARRSLVARIVAGAALVLWILSAAANVYVRIERLHSYNASAAYDRAHSRTLTSASTVSGMQLPSGTVLTTDPNFQLSWVELSEPAVLFGVPLAGRVSIVNGKLDGPQTLQHDATIDGLPCAASDPVTFDAGHLTNCRLARPATVRGVPCRNYTDVSAGFLGCELASPYSLYGTTWYEGTDARGGGGEMTFTTGARAPSLRVYGSALPKGTIVAYRNGTLAMLTFVTPLHYRGCTIHAIERRNGVMRATESSGCGILRV